MTRELSDHGEARRIHILRHAALLFERNGYAATRVSDIARAAGVAKGLVFWYFGSKEDLLHQLAGTVQNGLIMLIRDTVRGLPEPIHRLYAGVLTSVYYVDENYHFYGAINAGSRVGVGTPYQETLKWHAADTGATIARWQARGAVRDDESAEKLAYLVNAIINEMVRFHRMGLLGRSIAEAAALGARSAVHALAASQADAQAAIAAHARLARRAAAVRRRQPPPIPTDRTPDQNWTHLPFPTSAPGYPRGA